MLKKSYVLGVGITSDNRDEILKYLLLSLEKQSSKYYIVTPNPEILVYSQDHSQYKKILNEAKIALPDGVGVFLAAALNGSPLRERITGVDLMEELCKSCVERPISIGFLGGRRGVAKRTAECLKARYPWIEVVFAAEEWTEDNFARGPVSRFPRPTSSVTSFPAGARRGSPTLATPRSIFPAIDILFVAFGHPKQEEWIYENFERLPVKVAMGVGGAFDYISGESARAPFMVRFMGFEWLYRLIREPWRWRRQLALPKFVWLVLREGLRRLKR